MINIEEEDTLYLLIPSIIMLITLMFFCISPFIIRENDKLLDLYSSDEETTEETTKETTKETTEETKKIN